MSVLEAQRLGLGNFSILCAQVRVPPAVEAILGDADSRVVARLRSTRLSPSDPVATGFHFDTGRRGRVELVHSSEAALDAEGDRHTEFSLAASEIVYGNLEVESSVRDDRGKYLAGSSAARSARSSRSATA